VLPECDINISGPYACCDPVCAARHADAGDDASDAAFTDAEADAPID